jgi:glycosyltransferase involved in cell wall biosynthesis
MLVTIVVPVYNRAHTLPRLFDSLKGQDYRPLEIILVDKNSTDESLAVCRQFSEQETQEDFSVLVAQEQTPGAAAARNCGLKFARGEWVSFFDSDDEMSRDFISSMLAALEKCPTADFVATRSKMVFEDGTEQVRGGLEHLSLHTHILSAALSTQSFVARVAYIKEIGGWNSQVLFWNDYELGIRMLQNTCDFVVLDRAFHRIYQHKDSITGASLRASFPKMQVALPIIEQQILTHNYSSPTAYRLALVALYFRFCILAGKLQQEGNREAKLWLTQRAERVVQLQAVSKCAQFIGRLLRFYTAHGGRGAWRIASEVIRF